MIFSYQSHILLFCHKKIIRLTFNVLSQKLQMRQIQALSSQNVSGSIFPVVILPLLKSSKGQNPNFVQTHPEPLEINPTSPDKS